MQDINTSLSFLKFVGDWQDVKNAAMTTINKDVGKPPTSQWIRKILMAEHSPIRKYIVNFKWEEVPYWVAMHFVRHHVGVQWFVGTQRDDRSGGDRSQKPQTAMVPLEGWANAQSLIDISKKRLCNQASPETRAYWQSLKDEIVKEQPELAAAMVSTCVYRGFCPEFYPCGYCNTENWKEERKNYVINKD